MLERVRKIIVEMRLAILRMRLKNKTPTILANNCNGTFIYHDMHLQFRSPTINLFFSIQDFLQFVEHLDYYLELSLIEKTNHEMSYPVGLLGDVELHFMHYGSFSEAARKWEERKKRIIKENLCVFMNEGKGCTYEDLLRFEALPFENKVVLTHKLYPELKTAYYIKGFEKKESCDYLFEYKRGSIRRYYEQFDYISFLNRMQKRRM